MLKAKYSYKSLKSFLFFLNICTYNRGLEKKVIDTIYFIPYSCWITTMEINEMPRYKVSFEYETEVEADDEHDAKLQVVEMWDWGNIGSMVVVEEIEESDISVVDKEIMTVKIDDVNNAIFNLNDLKETLKAHKLRDIKRVHEGTANEDTIGDLVDDLETFLLNTYNSLI